MEKKKEKTTIDDLARMVQGQFSDIKKDLDSLKESDRQILKKLEGVDKERVDGIDVRVKNIEDLFALPAKK